MACRSGAKTATQLQSPSLVERSEAWQAAGFRWGVELFFVYVFSNGFLFKKVISRVFKVFVEISQVTVGFSRWFYMVL